MQPPVPPAKRGNDLWDIKRHARRRSDKFAGISQFLMGYNRAVLRSRRAELMEKNVRVLWSGQGSRLRRALLRELRITEKLTRDNTGLTVQLCLNYGGRGEITDAVRQIARDVTLGKLRSSDIDEATVGKYLYQSGLPPVDLIIRTGGESRLSNFLLWQGGAAEVLVTDTMWPDFKGSEMRDACLRFADLSV